MCEIDDLELFSQSTARRGLTRREFSRLTLGVGLAGVLPSRVFADAPTGREVRIETPDGVADAFFVHPATGTHPGVLIWPDIFGLRPAFKDMATRLAAEGYAVLVINPFYRSQPAPTAPERADFSDPAVREALMALRNSLTAATAAVDATAFIGFLDQQAAVDTQRGVGTAGYCMGGPLVLRTAAAVPERVAAVASFHGGGLATDKPDSPHRLIPRMKAQLLIAIADNDDSKEPETKHLLRAAFAAAELPAEIEVYAGAKHGWCPPDSRAYDHTQAEKAWERLLALLGRALAG